jgi:hypothetical protein
LSRQEWAKRYLESGTKFRDEYHFEIECALNGSFVEEKGTYIAIDNRTRRMSVLSLGASTRQRTLLCIYMRQVWMSVILILARVFKNSFIDSDCYEAGQSVP